MALTVEAWWLRWVRCGERDDYAMAELKPPLQPQDSGAREVLRFVLLAPRHEGYNLKELTQFPVHVYVVTYPDALRDAYAINAEQLTIRIWGILTGPVER